MAEQMGVDIAWPRPTTDQIRATGARWVGRYFSTDDTKDLTAAEVEAYPAAGLAIVTVWETTAGRATQGAAAGTADAWAAEQQRERVGLAVEHVHHFAVDEDVAWDQVEDYFAGAASVIGKDRVGVYGGYAVIEGAAAVGYRYLWQTIAWSAGRWSAHATIRQTGATTLGGDADVDQAMADDFGQTPPPEDDMPLTDADMTLLLGTRIPEAKMPNGYIPTVADCLNGAKTSDTQLTSLAAQVGALSGAVTALAKAVGVAGGITAEQVQAAAEAGATAALAALGQDLTAASAPATGAAVSAPATS
jgi:hypothetical protein